MTQPTANTVAPLPRLAYIGDVPVRATTAGSVLIHRLLETYPPDRLRVVEAEISKLPEGKNLPGVDYRVISCLPSRPLYTRFTSPYARLMHLTAAWFWRRAEKALEGFQFDAVLSVMHGYTWRIASVIAKKHNVPLHMIVHDDWFQIQNEFRTTGARVAKDMGDVYRQSASRLCVCPQMEEAYMTRYGVHGTVLYPSRAVSSPEHPSPPERVGQRQDRITVVYAGSIFMSGYAQALATLGAQLEKIGGRLIIYCTVDKAKLAEFGLNQSNIDVRDFIPASAVVGRLREEADIVFVPMTFQPELRVHMETSFPSKIAEYTAVGVPMLIWGPAYCSAVRWAKSNAPVAEVVDTEDSGALEAPLRRLADSPALRLELGQRSLDVGRKYFSHASAFEVLRQALAGK